MIDELLRAFVPFAGKRNFAEFVVQYVNEHQNALELRQEVLSKMEIEPMYSLEYCVLWSVNECLVEILKI